MQLETIEQYCKEGGYDLEQIETAAAMMPADLKDFIRATALRAVIIKGLNDGVVPDHKNYAQEKFEPIFDLSVPGPSGLGLAFHDADDWYADTDVGARLQILNRSDAKFFANHPNFQQLHCDALTYKTEK